MTFKPPRNIRVWVDDNPMRALADFKQEVENGMTSERTKVSSSLLGIFRRLPQQFRQDAAECVIRNFIIRPTAYEDEASQILLRHCRLIHYRPEKVFRVSDPHFLDFGAFCRTELKEQAQYGSRYIDGRLGYPRFVAPEHVAGNPSDYHTVLIHVDAMPSFHEQYWEHLKAKGVI